MKEYKSKDQFPTIASSIRSLIKGCEALKKLTNLLVYSLSIVCLTANLYFN